MFLSASPLVEWESGIGWYVKTATLFLSWERCCRLTVVMGMLYPGENLSGVYS